MPRRQKLTKSKSKKPKSTKQKQKQKQKQTVNVSVNIDQSKRTVPRGGNKTLPKRGLPFPAPHIQSLPPPSMVINSPLLPIHENKPKTDDLQERRQSSELVSNQPPQPQIDLNGMYEYIRDRAQREYDDNYRRPRPTSRRHNFEQVETYDNSPTHAIIPLHDGPSDFSTSQALVTTGFYGLTPARNQGVNLDDNIYDETDRLSGLFFTPQETTRTALRPSNAAAARAQRQEDEPIIIPTEDAMVQQMQQEEQKVKNKWDNALAERTKVSKRSLKGTGFLTSFYPSPCYNIYTVHLLLHI